MDSKGPVLFQQERIGKGKKHFQLFKFRTMTIDAPGDMPTHLFEDATSHITKIGRFLRRTSLDELPQLWNILKGEMSIIGPRPALWNQHDLIEERDKYGANDILPGLTGWAQINGRDEISIEIKAKLDGDYANNMSILLDLKCFLGTFGPVFRKEGIVEGVKNEEDRPCC
jgi:O-antigen biosynthesis protein WbqP